MRFSFNFEDGSDIVIRATNEGYDSKFFVWEEGRAYPNAQKKGLTYKQAKWLTENFEWIKSDNTPPSVMFSCLVDLFKTHSLNSVLDYLKHLKHKLRTPEKSQKELWIEWYRCEFKGRKSFGDFNYISADEDGEVNYHDNKPYMAKDYFIYNGFGKYHGVHSIHSNLDWKQSCIAVSEIWPEAGEGKSETGAVSKPAQPIDSSSFSVKSSDAKYSNSPDVRSKEKFFTLRVGNRLNDDISIPNIEINRVAIHRLQVDKKMRDELNSNTSKILSRMKLSCCKEAEVVFKLKNGSATIHDIHVIVPKPSQPPQPPVVIFDEYKDIGKPVSQKEINLNSIKISHEKTLSEYLESQRQVIEPRNKTFDTVAGLGVVSKITGR